jgi:plastocyanin
MAMNLYYMKTITFFFMALFVAQSLKAQTTHIVQEVGFTYDPATLTINTGESVQFNGTASHPIVQVSEAIWNANGATPLEGGFSFPTGSGTMNFPDAGTFYYVCTAHVASFGMKGKIIVQAPTVIDEVILSEKYAVFPVPLTGNELTVALKTTGQNQVFIDIYDLAGKCWISSLGNTIDGKYLIDCSSLPKGLFLMKMKTDEVPFFAKIVKL